MSYMSFSHRQLLKTMFEYELRNHVEVEIQKLLEKKPLSLSESRDFANILIVKEYIESRVDQLK